MSKSKMPKAKDSYNFNSLNSEFGPPHSNIWIDTFLKASPVGIGFLIERTIVKANDSFCKMVGYDQSELIGKSSRFLYPSDVEFKRVGVEKYKNTKTTESGSVKTTFVKKDGEFISVLLSSTAIDPGDLRKGVVLTVTDLTKIDSAEKRYSESVEKYETFFNSVDDALFVHPYIKDGFGNFVEVNDIACQRYGYTRGEFLKMKVTDITVFTNLDEHAERQNERDTTDPKPIVFEAINITKSGEEFPVEINSNIVQLGGVKYIMGVVRNISERVENQKEIRESEEINRNIIQTALDGFLSINLEGQIHNVNQAYCSMMGYSREELLSMSVKNLVATLSQEEIKETIGSIYKNGSGSFRVGHRRKDGNIVDLHVSARYLHLHGGLIVAFLKNITKSNAEEKIISTRLDLMGNYTERSIDEIIQKSIDRAEELTRSKIAFFHFLDSDQNTLLLQTWSTNTLKNMCTTEGKGSHYSIDKAGVWVEAIQQRKPVIHNDYNSLNNKKGLPAGHAPVLRELVVPIFEGSQIKALIGVGNKESAYTEQDIEIVSKLGEISFSIYEKKRAEEELQNSNFWLNEAQRISNSGYYIFNIKQSTWTTSKVLDNILGIDEHFNKTIETYFDLIHPEHLEEMKEYVMKMVIGEHKPFDKVYLIRRISDGESRWVHGLGQTIYDMDGNPEKIVGTIRDVHDQKLAEFNLIAAKEKAEESDRLKSTFLATMSHELRTPLNAVIGFSNLIAEGTDMSSLLEMNKYVSESGNRLLRIIESIFDISMLETKNAGLMQEEFSAADFFTSISYTIKAELEKENKLHLRLLYKPDPDYKEVAISTDRLKLLQLIANLVNNSIKYTEEGVINYGYTVNNKEITFFVKDTGIGIPAEKHEIIFEKFRQVDESHTRTHSGVGLGLAICKEISTLLNGRLWVESEPGKGSAFFFSIEGVINSNRRIPDSITHKKEIPDLRGKTILVAEDVDSNYLYLEKVLEQTNVRVVRANSGNEAVRLIRDNIDIDLVLMDIRMPGLNGYDATMEIKKIRSALPVIAQTAYAMKDDRSRALESGCDDYLSKPIKTESLFSLLNKFLG